MNQISDKDCKIQIRNHNFFLESSVWIHRSNLYNLHINFLYNDCMNKITVCFYKFGTKYDFGFYEF